MCWGCSQRGGKGHSGVRTIPFVLCGMGWGSARAGAPWSGQGCLTDLWPQGVVPYLGTFLKDLVMLDAASKDELEVSGVCSGMLEQGLRAKQTALQGGAQARALGPHQGSGPSARVLVLSLWGAA